MTTEEISDVINNLTSSKLHVETVILAQWECALQLARIVDILTYIANTYEQR